VAPEFWQNPDTLKNLYVSTGGNAASGTQLTQPVAGTTVLNAATAASSTAVAEDVARNLASNSLANAGRGNTSTGAAVSVASETMVPFSAFSHFTNVDVLDSSAGRLVGFEGFRLAPRKSISL